MGDESPKKKIRITDMKVAFTKAASYCAYQERCQQEVRDKLYSWGLWPEAVENIITQLITENFLNEERFAKAFAGGKFRIKRWGRVKIKMELKKRKISDYCIKQAMKEIDERDYMKVLRALVKEQEEKLKKKKLSGRFAGEIKKQKIMQYCLARGFEQDLVRDLMER
ncbi:MAG TPA: regulatory protein RecX [Bacteroidia bacterium]|jgi:regulatory protein